MRTIRILLLIIVSSLAISACKKTKDKQSNMDLLTSAPWVMIKLEEREDNDPWENTFPALEACEKDDRWIFKTDMSVNLTEGPVACSGNSPNEVLESTTWSFLDNETKLKIEDDNFVIEQLDGTTLVISISETFAGTTYATKATFGH